MGLPRSFFIWRHGPAPIWQVCQLQEMTSPSHCQQGEEQTRGISTRALSIPQTPCTVLPGSPLSTCRFGPRSLG